MLCCYYCFTFLILSCHSPHFYYIFKCYFFILWWDNFKWSRFPARLHHCAVGEPQCRIINFQLYCHYISIFPFLFYFPHSFFLFWQFSFLQCCTYFWFTCTWLHSNRFCAQLAADYIFSVCFPWLLGVCFLSFLVNGVFKVSFKWVFCKFQLTLNHEPSWHNVS